MLRWRCRVWHPALIRRIHWWHARHPIWGHAIRRRVVATAVHIRHHFATRDRRHGVAMVSATAMPMPSMSAVSAAMCSMSIKVAARPTACRGRGKRIRTSRRKVILRVSIGVGGAKRYQLIGSRLWPTLEGVVTWVRHHARSISTGCSLVGNMRPLSTRVMRRLTRPGRIARVIVVPVQTVGVVGLGPSPTRPVSVVQCVSALRSVARRGIVDRRVARRFVARRLRSVAGSRRWRGNAVMLDSGRAGGRVGGLDLVNVVPIFLVVLVRLGVFFLAARRDLYAVLFVGKDEVFRASRMVDGDVSPKRNVDVSCAWTTHFRRDRNTGGSGGTRDTGRGNRSSTTDRAARKRPLGRGSATMRKGND